MGCFWLEAFVQVYMGINDMIFFHNIMQKYKTLFKNFYFFDSQGGKQFSKNVKFVSWESGWKVAIVEYTSPTNYTHTLH